MRAASVALSEFPLCLRMGSKTKLFVTGLAYLASTFTIVNLQFSRTDAMTTGIGRVRWGNFSSIE